MGEAVRETTRISRLIALERYAVSILFMILFMGKIVMLMRHGNQEAVRFVSTCGFFEAKKVF